MNSIMDTAIHIARSAGDGIRRAAADISSLNIEQKSLYDYVSEVDRESERLIVDCIKNTFPEHQVIGEEYGVQGPSEASYQWVIDPLDGTTNFLRSIPHYAVSIGVLNHGVLDHAVVYDPAKDELFTASRGAGSKLNGVPIQVSSSPSIRGALLSTGVPYSGENLEQVDAFSNTLTGLLKMQTSGLRRLGAAALDLAYVAAGRYDGFWEANLKKWDIAAGALLVKEAGGVVTNLHGASNYLESGNVLAANHSVHQDMLAVTKACYPELTKDSGEVCEGG